MYLTRFEFNTARRGARDLLASPHRLHGAVMHAFPAAQREPHRDPSAEGRILWRLDQQTDPRRSQALLYLVSPHEPDLTHIAEVAGRPTTQSWLTRPYQPLLDQLTTGQRWAFRLTANPTYSKPPAPGHRDQRGQRLGHVTIAQQTHWLLTRTEACGFTIAPTTDKEPDVAIRHRHNHKFTRHGSTVTIAAATFEGILDVTDPAALRHALTHGIGPAKSYGCGLLTLARP